MSAESKKTTEQLSVSDSLNRATLRMTFSTIRKSNASVALLIQNLLMLSGTPLNSKADGDLFVIDLADEDIEQIIQTLLALCLITSQQPYPSVNMNTLRGLLNQWTRVANYRKLFTEEADLG